MSSKMKKIKYQAGRVGSCVIHVIELNEKMLRFATKKKEIFLKVTFSDSGQSHD
jgi:hypothetical protein